MALFDDFPRGAPGVSSSQSRLGTARWSAPSTKWSTGLLWLGRGDDGEAIGHVDDRHIITIAGSRSGKGRSAIIPNLLVWPGSCVVTDPKGENATRTAELRSCRSGRRIDAPELDVDDVFRTDDDPSERWISDFLRAGVSMPKRAAQDRVIPRLRLLWLGLAIASRDQAEMVVR